MQELSASQVNIDDPFWTPRLLTNARVAIFHQWQQLESTHCIDNFRLVVHEKEGFREGWFFADSDAYKWLDAAARIYASWPDDNIKAIMDDLIALLTRVQMADGYIYTYNQIHFPGERWGNLMIEHELYCHGHLIEAVVSYAQATGASTALNIAIKAADLLVQEFMSASPDKTSGHEEIEIALLRLYEISGQASYMELAGKFLERRGRVHPFLPLIYSQNARVARRSEFVRQQHEAYLSAHPEHAPFQLPPDNYARKTSNSKLRWTISALSGKFFQQHAPIRRQTIPVGHSVRFGYLETAIAMLSRLNGDRTLLPSLEKAWERMVTRRMYVTGGIGSLPEIEGFGHDYELDPELAYNETCAALSSLFWNWEMTLFSGYAQYSDLFEWQLYNAAAVGMGLDGDDYLYNNPLLCRGGITRRPWFRVPCCPSNLSRTWASLGKYVYSFDDKNLWVNQYIGNSAIINDGKWPVRLVSSLPWEGKVSLHLDPEMPSEFTLHLRIPSWAAKINMAINGLLSTPPIESTQDGIGTASGYDPRQACYMSISRTWSSGDTIDLKFEMSITLRRASPHVRGHKRKVALTRGPLVYCLESLDNPGLDIFTAQIDAGSLQAESSPALLGGIWTLSGKTTKGQPFVAIPYHLWANRGESRMNVWLNMG